MKIGLIAHGDLPIPPRDHGAVEVIIWQSKRHLERLGHTVDIANTHAIHEVVHHANRGGYDFVHLHSELFARQCVAHLRVPFAVTSHFGGFHQFDPEAPETSGPFQYLFRDILQAPATIALSEQIRQHYLRCGYRGFLRVLRNGVEVDEFQWARAGNGRAICVGAICARKRQAWLAEIARGRVAVDFVGPGRKGPETDILEHETTTYLGVWDKPTLYSHLTDYSCLVLLSESEAAPKVVLEALAAGLSVVVTEAGAANLTDEPFITIVPDREQRPGVIAEAIQTAIDRNPGHREAIRQYAKARFDYPVVMHEYLTIIHELRHRWSSARSPMGAFHE
jgi:glycosyltransferase involved in cell wall biosynthesis